MKGRSLFGGMINSDTYKDYVATSKVEPDIKFEYFNFNDMIGSFLTLFALLLSSNWIEIYDVFYHVRPKFTTTAFFVFYWMNVTFFVTALMIGIIAKFVLIYFNGRLSRKIEEKKKKMKSKDEQLKKANILDLNG